AQRRPEHPGPADAGRCTHVFGRLQEGCLADQRGGVGLPGRQGQPGDREGQGRHGAHEVRRGPRLGITRALGVSPLAPGSCPGRRSVGPEPVIPEAAMVAVEAWKDWTGAVDFRPIPVERTVFCAACGHAGTADWIGMVAGRLTLGDYKTDGALYPE